MNPMGVTTRRRGSHKCPLPMVVNGEIVQCDECHRFWIGRTYPNPRFDGWYRLTAFSAWLRGVR